ncbi:MAG: nitroreductase family protein [Spirochaetaceae bacterium]|jgi:nitroreductase|nr:nitroreductase family protein [Spirochaetaceae bacterium]
MGDTLKDLKERRSTRKYKEDQISDSELNTILEAGTWAASGKGAQSGLIVVTQNANTIADLEKINAGIAGNKAAKTFYGAPTLVMVFADTDLPTWVDDGNMIIANLMIAAEAIGVASCYVYRARETFESAEGRALMKTWGIDEKYKAIGNVILGYSAENPAQRPPRKENYILKVN